MNKRARFWQFMRTPDSLERSGVRPLDMIAFGIPLSIAIVLSYNFGKSQWYLLSIVIGIVFMWGTQKWIPTPNPKQIRKRMSNELDLDELADWLVRAGLAEERHGYGHASGDELAERLLGTFTIKYREDFVEWHPPAN